MKSIYAKLLIITFLIFFISNVSFAQNTTQSTKDINTLDLVLRIATIVAALFSGFIAGNFNLIRAEKRKEIKESKIISYSLIVEKPAKIEQNQTVSNIKIAYKDRVYSDLTIITCHIKNVSKNTILNEQIRFEFSKNACEILEFTPGVEIEEEVGFQILTSNLPNEIKIKTTQLVPQKEIKVHFIVTGNDPIPKVWGFNEKGDVTVNEKSINSQVSDSETLITYISFNYQSLFLLLTVSFGCFMMNSLPIELNKKLYFYLFCLFVLILIASFNFHYKSFISRILSQIINKFLTDNKGTLEVSGNSNIVFYEAKLDANSLEIKQAGETSLKELNN